jgi:hypothetical protein
LGQAVAQSLAGGVFIMRCRQFSEGLRGCGLFGLREAKVTV